jgi:hypothetical protein
VAISLCVLSALLVATAIVALFVSAYLQFLPVLWIALVFGGALASLVGALFLFLREVYLSAATLYTDVQ